MNFEIVMYQTEDGLTKIETTLPLTTILFGCPLTKWQSCFSAIEVLLVNI